MNHFDMKNLNIMYVVDDTTNEICTHVYIYTHTLIDTHVYTYINS
jgi:hypothetical protein